MKQMVGGRGSLFLHPNFSVHFAQPTTSLLNMKKDQAVFDIIHKELLRQRNGIELIASENFTSLQVMQAMGNVMTNKYAEGYPGRRYYGGCEFVDETEMLAIERIKQVFNCAYANVQPHSGAQANASVMLAVLKPGDKILGLDLSMGGHLTHGSPVNFSGKIYQPFFMAWKKRPAVWTISKWKKWRYAKNQR